MIRNQELEQSHRIKLKALDEAFMHRIKEGTSCSRFECEAILEAVKDIYFPATIDSIKPGQMLFFAVSAKEPPNKPLNQCAFIQVVLTLHQGREDDELRLRRGVESLRQHQLYRMSKEALEQGGLLTLEDFAYKIFNCGLRTLSRDLKALKKKGIYPPLRSQQKDMGRALTHRVLAVELYLQRKSFSQIRAAIHHSYESIKNYIKNFAAVASLTKAGHSPQEISFFLQISPALVKEYQALFTRYHHQGYEDRIEEIMAQVRGKNILSLSQFKKGVSRR